MKRAEWNTTDLPRERIVRFFGGDWVAKIEAMPKRAAIAFCESRARGAWQANDREGHAAYRSLAVLLGGETEEVIANTRKSKKNLDR